MVAGGSHSAVSFDFSRLCLHRACLLTMAFLLRAILAQDCNLDWQRITYNQPKKLFWTAKIDQWGDLREKPDEFTGWETQAHSALLIRAYGNICAVDSRHRDTPQSPLCIQYPEGSD